MEYGGRLRVNSVLNAIVATWNQIIYALSNIRVFDIIDILIIAYFVFSLRNCTEGLKEDVKNANFVVLSDFLPSKPIPTQCKEL